MQWQDVLQHSSLTLAGSFWLMLWLLRGSRDETRWQDLNMFILALLWQNWAPTMELISPILHHIASIPLLVLVFTGFLSWVTFKSTNSMADVPHGQAPWLLPSRTSHTRMFPKKHSFAYSLLQVAVPVGSYGRFGSLMSVGDVKHRGWFHVQASDYLERNSTDTDLKSKLRTYLRSQGVEDTAWDHAYLITAPQFLGYAFNPASFWYIYTSQNVLTMMIIEVNNTFDERRMYPLHAKDLDEKSEDSHSSVPTTPGDDEKPIVLPKGLPDDGKFRKAWTKDFHVSPFNSRKGYYMLTAVDPLQGGPAEAPIFSNTITLKSSKDHVKLVARAFSNGKPINALTSSWREMIGFVFSWFWVGFLTFPRILKEAAVLFWSKGLHVWFRPEVMATSIGRKEEKFEADLAPFFESYLESLVSQCAVPIKVVYSSNLNGSLPKTFANMDNADGRNFSNADILEVRVLSPIFFARAMHYAHASEAFDRECVFTDEKNRTIWLSRPDLMYKLLKSCPKVSTDNPKLSLLRQWRWNVHKHLRCHPAAPAYPASSAVAHVEDIRQATLSELDRHVMTDMKADSSRYLRLCTRLFLAQRLALGFVPVIDLLDFGVRATLLWLGAAVASESLHGTWLKTVVMVNSVHIWAFIKA